MKCVFMGDQAPDDFVEKIEFSSDVPYTIHIKNFPVEEFVPMHYAETVEILFCDGLIGKISISGRTYSLSNQQFFVIPPYSVHSTEVLSCQGTMYVMKISLKHMKKYFDIIAYLGVCGTSLDTLSYAIEDCDEAFSILKAMIQSDGIMRETIPLLVQLIHFMSCHTDKQPSQEYGQFKDTSLQEIISWTYENCSGPVTLDQVAEFAGYSKYHFCTLFKNLTGMSYMNYLTSVRISRACQLLQNGMSVHETAAETGFANTSHFIQTFRKAQQMTPAQYARCCQKNL